MTRALARRHSVSVAATPEPTRRASRAALDRQLELPAGGVQRGRPLRGGTLGIAPLLALEQRSFPGRLLTVRRLAQHRGELLDGILWSGFL